MTTPAIKTPGRALKLLTATCLIGLAAAMTPVAHAFPGGMGGHGEMGAMGGRGMGMHGGGHMGRMLDQVGASAEQKAQIKAIMEAARNDLKPVQTQMKALRQQGAALFTQRNVDANAVEANRQQMQALHGQVSKRMAQAMVESSRVLTPEQRTKMADLMSKRRAMAERHRAEAESLMGKPAGTN